MVLTSPVFASMDSQMSGRYSIGTLSGFCVDSLAQNCSLKSRATPSRNTPHLLVLHHDHIIPCVEPAGNFVSRHMHRIGLHRVLPSCDSSQTHRRQQNLLQTMLWSALPWPVFEVQDTLSNEQILAVLLVVEEADLEIGPKPRSQGPRQRPSALLHDNR